MIDFKVLRLLTELSKYLSFTWFIHSSINRDFKLGYLQLRVPFFLIQIMATNKLVEVDSTKVEHHT